MKALIAASCIAFCTAAWAGPPPTSETGNWSTEGEARNVAWDGVSASEVPALLRRLGYWQIRVVDRSPPVYHAEACRGDLRYGLSVNRAGRIVQRDQLGSCDERSERNDVSLPDVKSILRSRGFSQINVLRTSEAGLRAEACRDGVRYNLLLEPDGDIREHNSIGRCDRGFDDVSYGREEILRSLAVQNYDRVAIVRESPELVVEACRRDRKFRLEFSRSGDVESRSVVGFCEPEFASGPRVAGYLRYADREIDPQFGALTGQECQARLEALTATTSIRFDVDSTRLREEAKPLLFEIAKVARRCQGARIEVGGFTDQAGDHEANLVLSERRAQTVADFLVANGVDPDRLRARGFGERYPLTTGDTPIERELNRRIEFVVTWSRA
jgi:outer membrane protein OmpA-like peptidoglycan-associated protein